MRINSPQIVLPWLDTTGIRQYSRLNFAGSVDIRRVKRELRKFCIKHLGSQPPEEYIQYHIKRTQSLQRCKEHTKRYCTNRITNEFIKALEMSDAEYTAALHEADCKDNASIQDPCSPEAGREVSNLQSGLDSDGTKEPLC